jgi:hypothetical protein
MGRTEFPDLNLDYERALVGRAKAKASTRAKWRALRSARSSTLKKVFDSADIVRDGMLRQLPCVGNGMGAVKLDAEYEEYDHQDPSS